jgi:peptide methionine sulfoxide reductase MsrB
VEELNELDSKWIAVKAMLQERFGKIPDMEGIIYLIGINEVGFDENYVFKKEEKQDLMHVATCTLLSFDGYYKFTNHDADGWPHFEKQMDFPGVTLKEQDDYMKEKIIQYFEVD